jgi:thiol-disulfide isomerase/thioredoxin
MHGAALNGCVATFSARWCGPCRQSKPALEQLVTSTSCAGIAYEEALGEETIDCAIKDFPTYVLFRNGRKPGD